MAATVIGPQTIAGGRDAEGYRTYTVKWKVRAAETDAVEAVRAATNLPRPGDEYDLIAWGFPTELNPWAWCSPEDRVEMAIDEKSRYWIVEQTFSSKPPEGSKSRCNDNPIEDPLLEPQKVSGGSVKYTEEAAYDRFGLPILTSSLEQVRGPQVEFDANRDRVKVEQNVPVLELALCASMRDKVNQYPMWGLPPRCVKLSDFTWEKKYYGRCYAYYTRTFEFDINAKTFDRDLLDEGAKALHGENRRGRWIVTAVDEFGSPPDPLNPLHFVRYKDAHGENARCILNGYGRPIEQVQAGLRRQFMSISKTHTPYDYEDPTKWVRVSRPLSRIPEWTPGAYSYGTVVHIADPISAEAYWLVINEEGTRDAPVPTGSADWLVVAYEDQPPTFRGDYTPGATYAVGDYVVVEEPGTGTGAGDEPGHVYVEKYDEADLLLLGIPTEF